MSIEIRLSHCFLLSGLKKWSLSAKFPTKAIIGCFFLEPLRIELKNFLPKYLFKYIFLTWLKCQDRRFSASGSLCCGGRNMKQTLPRFESCCRELSFFGCIEVRFQSFQKTSKHVPWVTRVDILKCACAGTSIWSAYLDQIKSIFLAMRFCAIVH